MQFTGELTRVIFRDGYDEEANALLVKRNWRCGRAWDYMCFDRGREGRLLPVYRPAVR
ncbi:MAG: hypothetical protein AB7V27_18100 [Candidatus Binatia bacterium]